MTDSNKKNFKPRGKGKRSILVEETAAKLGFDPFKTICLFAMGDWEALGYDSSVEVKQSKDGESTFLQYTITPELRAACAKDACRYLYSPKPSSVDLSADEGIQVEVIRYVAKK
jgi:hypothetical protein